MTETCVTVPHCLIVSNICKKSDAGVVKCIASEWNSGTVVLKCGEAVEQWHSNIIVRWNGGIVISSVIELMNSGTVP